METKKKCRAYYRIRKGVRKDPEAVRRSLQKRLGVKHPEWINGWQGLFFGTGDVFVSDEVAGMMKLRSFREFIRESLDHYERGEYGEVSRETENLNIENRWLSGGDLVMGRYGYNYDYHHPKGPQFDEILRIRSWKGSLWITFDSEPDLFLLLKDNRSGPEQARAEKQEGQPEEEPADPAAPEPAGLDEIYDETPLFTIPYRRDSPGTRTLLRHGIITEEDLED